MQHTASASVVHPADATGSTVTAGQAATSGIVRGAGGQSQAVASQAASAHRTAGPGSAANIVAEAEAIVSALFSAISASEVAAGWSADALVVRGAPPLAGEGWPSTVVVSPGSAAVSVGGASASAATSSTGTVVVAASGRHTVIVGS